MIRNAGFTTGVSLGAVVFGGLIGKIGWVRSLPLKLMYLAGPLTIFPQRPLFWAQAPAALLAGCAIFLSIPGSMRSPGHSIDKDVTLRTKLKRIDYLGAIFLVCSPPVYQLPAL